LTATHSCITLLGAQDVLLPKRCFWPFSDSMEKLGTYTCLYSPMEFSDWVHIHMLDPQSSQLDAYS